MTIDSRTLRATLEALCYLQATEQEMADYLGGSVGKIERLKRDPHYAQIFTQARAEGKIALRRAQWKKALEGNADMLIWLGQQVLGQWDRPLEGAQEEPVQDRLAELRRLLDTLSEADFRQFAEEKGIELPSEEDPSGDAPGNSKFWTREWDLTSIPNEVFDAESNRRGPLSRRAAAEDR